ncbi:hypothetical protein [Moritella sp. 28]|uniref:hypothetical protein n=1 Tax=Moritella sp. 28 TaxID=2746232 RepID=UPI001BA49066|nr:hypothetical protein [Moritella sp. 28]QUM83594.1 hypothetical protein HWV02_03195 [Moritella sp. 28]
MLDEILIAGVTDVPTVSKEWLTVHHNDFNISERFRVEDIRHNFIDILKAGKYRISTKS